MSPMAVVEPTQSVSKLRPLLWHARASRDTFQAQDRAAAPLTTAQPTMAAA